MGVKKNLAKGLPSVKQIKDTWKDGWNRNLLTQQYSNYRFIRDDIREMMRNDSKCLCLYIRITYGAISFTQYLISLAITL